MDKGLLEGVIRYGCDSLEDGVSGLLRGLGDTKEVCYIVKGIIIRDPLIDDPGCPFDRIGLYHILFYLVLFSPILGHNAAPRFLYLSHVDT